MDLDRPDQGRGRARPTAPPKKVEPRTHGFPATYDQFPIRVRSGKNARDVWTISAKHRRNLEAHCFVDEAGDDILFNRRKQIVVGQAGCSNYFILGMAWVLSPGTIATELDALRTALVADPYFRNVPSLDPARRRTALFFHAKDYPPEVRREVFRVITQHPIQFFVVVRDKHSVAAEVRRRNQQDPAYRYRPNELYDSMVARLLDGRLHKDESYSMCFARRGSADRTAALQAAVERAQEKFRKKWAIESTPPIKVTPLHAHQSVGLQVADYILWAVQRLYERNEDRYFSYVRPTVRLVLDVDDIRSAPYGMYYTVGSELSAEVLKGRCRRI